MQHDKCSDSFIEWPTPHNKACLAQATTICCWLTKYEKTKEGLPSCTLMNMKCTNICAVQPWFWNLGHCVKQQEAGSSHLQWNALKKCSWAHVMFCHIQSWVNLALSYGQPSFSRMPLSNPIIIQSAVSSKPVYLSRWFLFETCCLQKFRIYLQKSLKLMR